jgi:hypothetical protein
MSPVDHEIFHAGAVLCIALAILYDQVLAITVVVAYIVSLVSMHTSAERKKKLRGLFARKHSHQRHPPQPQPQPQPQPGLPSPGPTLDRPDDVIHEMVSRWLQSERNAYFRHGLFHDSENDSEFDPVDGVFLSDVIPNDKERVEKILSNSITLSKMS